MTNIIVVVLDFNNLSVPEIIEKGKGIILAMTGNSNFIAPNPLPIPTLAVASTNLTALEIAYGAALPGGTTLKAVMRVKKATVLKDFSNLRAYVHMIANNNPANGEAIALSAGMHVRDTPIHTAHEFNVRNGNTATAGRLVQERLGCASGGMLAPGASASMRKTRILRLMCLRS